MHVSMLHTHTHMYAYKCTGEAVEPILLCMSLCYRLPPIEPTSLSSQIDPGITDRFSDQGAYTYTFMLVCIYGCASAELQLCACGNFFSNRSRHNRQIFRPRCCVLCVCVCTCSSACLPVFEREYTYTFIVVCVRNYSCLRAEISSQIDPGITDRFSYQGACTYTFMLVCIYGCASAELQLCVCGNFFPI